MTKKKTIKIELETPIKREGHDPITSVTLRKPGAGELRGLKLSDVLQMDVVAITKLLPRISALLPDDIAELDAADIMSCAKEILGFFMSAKDKSELDALS